jgi:hypothetical protein
MGVPILMGIEALPVRVLLHMKETLCRNGICIDIVRRAAHIKFAVSHASLCIMITISSPDIKELV